MRFRSAAPDAREWFSFEDPAEQRTWVFDVTFFLSAWTCIYGNGCQGVLTGPSPELQEGCCSYGAHMTDEADAARVSAAASSLRPQQWQHYSDAGIEGPLWHDSEGVTMTRLVDGACIFLNRPGFAGGAGCALHRGAIEAGRPPMESKPDVCWQLPLRRLDSVDDVGHVTSTIGQWDRKHWGEGGAEFHWWCTEAPEAFVGSKPVFQAMEHELRAMTGDEQYDVLALYLERRRRRVGPLSHPAV